MSKHGFTPGFFALEGLSRDLFFGLQEGRRGLGLTVACTREIMLTSIPTISTTWAARQSRYAAMRRKTFTLGVAGPVGSGKTALVERLCRDLWPEINLAVITNDIYTHEDAEFLSQRKVLPLGPSSAFRPADARTLPFATMPAAI